MSKEEIKMALDALEASKGLVGSAHRNMSLQGNAAAMACLPQLALAEKKHLEAITALREALAQPEQEPVAGYVSKIESLIKERDALKAQLSNSPESGGFKHPAFAFRECEDSHAGEPIPPTIDGLPPELFAQQIAAAMRYAEAPLSDAQAVTLVLYLKARCDTDNAQAQSDPTSAQ